MSHLKRSWEVLSDPSPETCKLRILTGGSLLIGVRLSVLVRINGKQVNSIASTAELGEMHQVLQGA